jgi:hypothetical protein
MKTLLVFGLFTAVAFGVDVTPLPESAIFQEILKLIQVIAGGNVSLFVLGVSAVQVAIVLFRTTFGANLSGKWTLALLYALNALLVAMLAVGNGASFGDVIGGAAFLSLVMNGLSELTKHLFKSA